jgi:hypothetical protein
VNSEKGGEERKPQRRREAQSAQSFNGMFMQTGAENAEKSCLGRKRKKDLIQIDLIHIDTACGCIVIF